MASGIFEFFKAESMRDNLDASMAAGTVKAYAFDAGAHTIDFTNDKLLADITAGALEGSAVTLTNVTVADTGVVDADDFTFTAISGDTVEAILFTMVQGAAELLVCYNDSGDFTPDGNDVNVTVNASGLFKL